MSGIISEDALLSVMGERLAQDKQWGGPEHDDDHSSREFLAYIQKQVSKSEIELAGSKPDVADYGRERFVKIAALAIAAIERIDRARR